MGRKHTARRIPTGSSQPGRDPVPPSSCVCAGGVEAVGRGVCTGAALGLGVGVGLGVALGVGALVVVLGVYNGLTTDMRDKILGANAHAIVLSYVPSAFENAPDLLQRVRAVEGVTGATPFIYTEVMLSGASKPSESRFKSKRSRSLTISTPVVSRLYSPA